MQPAPRMFDTIRGLCFCLVILLNTVKFVFIEHNFVTSKFFQVVGASGDGLNNLLCDGVGINIVSGGKPASVKVLNNVNGDGTDHLKSHSNHTTNIQSYAKVAQNVADIIHATDSTDKIWKETIQKDNCDEGQIDNDIYVSPEGKVSGHFGDLSLSNGDIVDPASADSMICGGKMKVS